MESVRDRLRCVTEEIEDWRFLSFKTDGEVDRVAVGERRGSTRTEEGEAEGEDEDIKMEDGDGEGQGNGDDEGY